MLQRLGLRDITIRQFSRINFTHTVLSKRKLQFFVDQGLVTGWDDPALPTVRGVLARGLSPQALREFILSQVCFSLRLRLVSRGLRRGRACRGPT